MKKNLNVRLQIETVSTCNASCGFCIYKDTNRAGGIMDDALFKRIVNETATIENIGIYSLQGLGEPLLDRKIEDRILYIYNNDPGSMIEMFSNGVYLTPERVDNLKAFGLDALVISLNAVNAEQHQRIMGLRNKFDIVCANIEDAIDGGLDVRVHAVVDGKDFTMEDAHAFKEKWGNRGKCISEGNWSGDLGSHFPECRPFQPNECCSRALTMIYIMYDGRVSMCCFDPTGKTIFGDLNTQTLREVYASEHYVKFREDHFNDRADKWEQCRVCTRI